jgi:hypothetical protein
MTQSSTSTHHPYLWSWWNRRNSIVVRFPLVRPADGVEDDEFWECHRHLDIVTFESESDDMINSGAGVGNNTLERMKAAHHTNTVTTQLLWFRRAVALYPTAQYYAIADARSPLLSIDGIHRSNMPSFLYADVLHGLFTKIKSNLHQNDDDDNGANRHVVVTVSGVNASCASLFTSELGDKRRHDSFSALSRSLAVALGAQPIPKHSEEDVEYYAVKAHRSRNDFQQIVGHLETFQVCFPAASGNNETELHSSSNDNHYHANVPLRAVWRVATGSTSQANNKSVASKSTTLNVLYGFWQT